MTAFPVDESLTRDLSGNASAASRLRSLHQRIAGCHRCVEAGALERAAPVLAVPTVSRLVLVGQAPGRVEEGSGRPFSGRAGRILFRWLERAGLGQEEEARRRVYLTSITKCFPGPAPSGGGDRRPSRVEAELCRPFLTRQLQILDPWLVLLVGQMALAHFLGPIPMERAVGRVLDPGGEPWSVEAAGRSSLRPLFLPLPHPSGASRWLNDPEHKLRLEEALTALGRLVRASLQPPDGGSERARMT
ncbi:MAG: uracil-DNA glycosylase [Candidatus Dormibacteria bacterium]